MSHSSYPVSERERAERLRSLGLLDGDDDPVYDAVAELAAAIALSPVGLLSFTDEARLSHRARYGTSIRETLRTDLPCSPVVETGVAMRHDSDEPWDASEGSAAARLLASSWYATPVRAPDGVVVGMLSVWGFARVDLTPAGEKILAELADRVTRLLERRSRRPVNPDGRSAMPSVERLYQPVIETLAEGVVVQDAKGTILASNRSAERILKMSADEMHGRTSLDPSWRAVEASGEPFPGEDHPAMVTLRTGEALTNVVMGVRRGGDDPTWISINTRPLFREGVPSPDGVVCSFFDITEAKNLERALLASEATYRSLFNYSMDGILLTTPAGDVLAANPAACAILGREEGALVASGCTGVVDRRDPRLLPAFDERERTGTVRAELTLLRADGTTFPAEVTSYGFIGTDGERRTTMSFRDLTELRRVDRLKGEFVSTVSHELRTPLTAIRGALGLVANGVTGEVPLRAAHFVSIALSSAERLSRLVNDLLDLEKLQSGTLTLLLAPLELGAVVRLAVSAHEPFAVTRAVSLNIEEPLADPRVIVDADRLAQVITNILSNAVKFSPRGGAVDISTSIVGDTARVSIKDRGPGIPEAFRSRMFERFAQADSSDSREKEGTGLGLNISKTLVEAMGGRIRFEPRAGGGTVFMIDVRLDSAAASR